MTETATVVLNVVDIGAAAVAAAAVAPVAAEAVAAVVGAAHAGVKKRTREAVPDHHLVHVLAPAPTAVAAMRAIKNGTKRDVSNPNRNPVVAAAAAMKTAMMKEVDHVHRHHVQVRDRVPAPAPVQTTADRMRAIKSATKKDVLNPNHAAAAMIAMKKTKKMIGAAHDRHAAPAMTRTTVAGMHAHRSGMKKVVLNPNLHHVAVVATVMKKRKMIGVARARHHRVLDRDQDHVRVPAQVRAQAPITVDGTPAIRSGMKKDALSPNPHHVVVAAASKMKNAARHVHRARDRARVQNRDHDPALAHARVRALAPAAITAVGMHAHRSGMKKDVSNPNPHHVAAVATVAMKMKMIATIRAAPGID